MLIKSVYFISVAALCVGLLTACGDSTSEARKAAPESKGLPAQLPKELTGLPTTIIKECNLEVVDEQRFGGSEAVTIASNSGHTFHGWIIHKEAGVLPEKLWVRLTASDGASQYGSATEHVERPDVADVHGAAFAAAGFKFSSQAGALKPGDYVLALTALSKGQALVCEPGTRISVH